MVTLDADYFLTARYSAGRLQDLFVSRLKSPFVWRRESR